MLNLSAHFRTTRYLKRKKLHQTFVKYFEIFDLDKNIGKRLFAHFFIIS